ncbi:hypothetical protein GGP41_007058 [Bipolaris sorokiniana]|uniref:Uncharacterized protein n=1 Tax=Cochliobolus sativus TaxID=45130 RepID=A0A8H5ZP20_COCSA|nr:hypothetical protein GGP41_007058 [Bipolaris sorokiniana]
MSRRRDTIGATVIGAFNRAVLGACCIVRTSGLVPLVASVAVRVAPGRMEPTPVGINDDFSIHVTAGRSACASATLPRDLGMRLCLLGSNDPSGHAMSGEGQECRGDRNKRHS